MKNFWQKYRKTIISSILVFTFGLNIFYFFILPPKVIKIIPADNSENIFLNSEITINFDKPVKRQEVEHIIMPEVYGEWKFENPLIKNHLYRTLVFVPAIDFEPDTQYGIELKNIINPLGLGLSNDFSFSFRTEKLSEKENLEKENKSNPDESNNPKINSSENEPKPKITLLNIPIDWQDYSLSCEAASLKMALSYKKVFVLENEIMEKIDYDLTPHKDNIWGDPYIAYVGDIDGKICSTGFGVFWEPVAEAANHWRPAQAFSNWKLENLIKEIEAGNPVIAWGTLPVYPLTDCSWYTPEGKYIKAFKQTHVRLVVGFIGESENPSKIILNDPLSGKLYWSADYFLTNWSAFDYSGVAVR